MSQWIAGILAIAAWTYAVFIFLRWAKSNNEFERFHRQAAVEMAPVNAARESGDRAALGAALQHLVSKWRYVAEVQVPYAEFLEQEGRFDEAIRLLKAYLGRCGRIVDENRRSGMWPLFFLVRILHKAKQSAEAERLAAKSVGKPHALPHLSLLYAQIALDRGDEAVAMDRFGEAVSQFPTDVDVAERYIRELLQRGMVAEAEAELLDGMRRMDRAQSLRMIYAKLAHDRADWPAAAERWAELRENFVFTKEAYTEGAVALRAMGRDAEADAVLASRPSSIGQID